MCVCLEFGRPCISSDSPRTNDCHVGSRLETGKTVDFFAFAFSSLAGRDPLPLLGAGQRIVRTQALVRITDGAHGTLGQGCCNFKFSRLRKGALDKPFTLLVSYALTGTGALPQARGSATAQVLLDIVMQHFYRASGWPVGFLSILAFSGCSSTTWMLVAALRESPQVIKEAQPINGKQCARPRNSAL